MPYPYAPPAGNVLLTVNIADVSSGAQKYVAPGFSGKIKRITSALNGAITGSDATLTTKIGGTAVTGGALTITQSGSAAGDVDTTVPTALNSFSATDTIEIEHSGGSAQIAIVTLELVPA